MIPLKMRMTKRLNPRDSKNHDNLQANCLYESQNERNVQQVCDGSHVQQIKVFASQRVLSILSQILENVSICAI